MSDRARDVIAETLEGHRKSWYVQSAVASCDGGDCDWGSFGTIKSTDERHREHLVATILAALEAAGAMVELPPGNADRYSVDWQPITGWDLAAQKGQVHIDEASNEPLSPHEARALAAALLAAANRAEQP